MRIEKAETVLRQMGMRVFRVRHYGSLARLELGEKEMQMIFDQDHRNCIVQHLESLGYQTVTVDLKGYRMGSMNEVLPANYLKDSNS